MKSKNIIKTNNLTGNREGAITCQDVYTIKNLDPGIYLVREIGTTTSNNWQLVITK